jgi:transposase
VAELHKLKTDLFMGLVEGGAMPLRPGVKRVVAEAIAAGARDACSWRACYARACRWRWPGAASVVCSRRPHPHPV